MGVQGLKEFGSGSLQALDMKWVKVHAIEGTRWAGYMKADLSLFTTKNWS